MFPCSFITLFSFIIVYYFINVSVFSRQSVSVFFHYLGRVFFHCCFRFLALLFPFPYLIQVFSALFPIFSHSPPSIFSRLQRAVVSRVHRSRWSFYCSFQLQIYKDVFTLVAEPPVVVYSCAFIIFLCRLPSLHLFLLLLS